MDINAICERILGRARPEIVIRKDEQAIGVVRDITDVFNVLDNPRASQQALQLVVCGSHLYKDIADHMAHLPKESYDYALLQHLRTRVPGINYLYDAMSKTPVSGCDGLAKKLVSYVSMPSLEDAV